jgi:hypothetical protein
MLDRQRSPAAINAGVSAALLDLLTRSAAKASAPELEA